MKKKPHTHAKRAPAPRFGPHPDDARNARRSAEAARQGKFVPLEDGYALLDEMLGEPFPRPPKK